MHPVILVSGSTDRHLFRLSCLLCPIAAIAAPSKRQVHKAIKDLQITLRMLLSLMALIADPEKRFFGKFPRIVYGHAHPEISRVARDRTFRG